MGTSVLGEGRRGVRRQTRLNILHVCLLRYFACMLVLFILLVSTSFINTESSIYLKQSQIGRVLTRGSIGEGQGERWEDKVERHDEI